MVSLFQKHLLVFCPIVFVGSFFVFFFFFFYFFNNSLTGNVSLLTSLIVLHLSYSVLDSTVVADDICIRYDKKVVELLICIRHLTR